jgi:predicted O-methyltransferase YrrM
MDESLREVLRELYSEGQRYDAAQGDRTRQRRNLEPDAAEFLWWLAQAVRAKTIVEVGTSNGFSTLWLADAARITGAQVLSVDLDVDAQREARGSLRRAGLESFVELRSADGGETLSGLPNGSVDLLFLDAERTCYPAWWPAITTALGPAGVLVVDNAMSHETEVAPLRALLDEDPAMSVTQLDLGKGELVAVRTRLGWRS